ncbi:MULTISPECIES: STAS domain-containing protein [Pseudomonadati]|uniref:STAS domain-containing protein n=1 Tax=Shewanella aestuarii TaxID=1028752 RepID=A0ABT0L4Y8_9GAMM|nr:STAS domain-containing protein [Shewanella aestuarii]MCL1118769.1 STAS domain-containing protein [Shewanella aestuarii]GGN79861.1 hypothetical protein GCM10009193_24350 [Shewanella aestuarii]
MTETTLDLGTAITIRNIQPIYSQLANHLQQTTPFIIDASKLTKVDTAGAQLLLFLHQTSIKRSINITWLPADKEISKQLALLAITIPPLISSV